MSRPLLAALLLTASPALAGSAAEEVAEAHHEYEKLVREAEAKWHEAAAKAARKVADAEARCFVLPLHACHHEVAKAEVEAGRKLAEADAKYAQKIAEAERKWREGMAKARKEAWKR